MSSLLDTPLYGFLFLFGAAGLLYGLQLLAIKVFPAYDPFDDRCPRCGKFALTHHSIHLNPPSFALLQCGKCKTDFVREDGITTARDEFSGALGIEHLFRELEYPERDAEELWLELKQEQQHEEGNL